MQINERKQTTGFEPKSVGTLTGIWGFYDFQSYGAPCNFIEVNPNSPNHIHSMMTVKYDSGDGATSPSRRISYSYSSDGGTTWSAAQSDTQTFLPRAAGDSVQYRSGFGSLQLYPGNNTAAIVTQKRPLEGGSTQTVFYLDASEGARNFSEYATPLYSGGSDQPIHPQNTFTTSGYMAMVGGRVNANSVHKSRMTSPNVFEDWSSALPVGDARLTLITSGTNGKVAIITYSSTLGGLYYMESDNEGISFGTNQPIFRTAVLENDTFAVQSTGFDALYVGTDLYVTFAIGEALYDTAGNFTSVAVNSKCKVMLWKKSANLSNIVIDKNNAPGTMLNTLSATDRAQYLHSYSLNFPSIGKTTNGALIIACDYFQQNISDTAGWNYSDILIIASTNNGTSWTEVRNVTNTPAIDERYVGISSWNPNGWAYLQFQEDEVPGTSIQPEIRLVTRCAQKFLKYNLALLDVHEEAFVPKQFLVSQNFPNPFNPITNVKFEISQTEIVTVKIYDVLGNEVSTLLNRKTMNAGEHFVEWDASNHSSGIYFYQIQMEHHSAVKKMVVLK
ncbi:MAG: T9SS type A sorting domain-containing protein [Ignavibacteriales bacterium]|nr:T9SS type A sorting domain-containing protein [Ignavibacteriales bacterium]